jgi:glycosyltransferase involved in cell wall biosynthesis
MPLPPEPRVSVLLPVCNAEPTLADALDSIASQTFAEHEVLVVLNGCTDGSAEVARSRAAIDRRLRVMELPRPGLVEALNCGMGVARTPLVARMDADDRMLGLRLEVQCAALDQHPDWDAVASQVRYVRHDTGPCTDGMRRYVDWLNTLQTPEAIRHSRFIDAPIAHPSVCFRRDAVLALGGYRSGEFPEDLELWLRMFEAGAVIGTVAQMLVEWCDGPRRLTRTDPRYAKAPHRALRHRYLLSGPLRNGRHCRIWGAGAFGRDHARDLRLAGAAVDDLIDIDPRKIGRRVAGGLPIVGLDSVREPDGRLILVCVGSLGAREQISSALHARGHQPERDYLALQ